MALEAISSLDGRASPLPFRLARRASRKGGPTMPPSSFEQPRGLFDG